MKRSNLERLRDAELEKLYNDTQSDVKRKDRQYDMLPAAWADRAGAPAIAELARAERAALLSFLPTHRPWDDVTAYDVRI